MHFYYASNKISPPLEKGKALPSLVEIPLWFWRRKFLKSANWKYPTILLKISCCPSSKDGYYAKFGWNRPSCSEEDENVKDSHKQL